VFLDRLWLKRNWGGEVRNVSLLAGDRSEQRRFREVLAVERDRRKTRPAGRRF